MSDVLPRETTSTPVSGGVRPRLRSLDIVRGAVMVLMALDHVRVYSGLPPGGPTPGIFFTRWVTHFCAPAFIFLAGTGAFLHGRKLGNRAALSRLLLTRGAWLVLLELTVLRVAWTFNFDFGHYLMAGVIWAIGWCMILLSLLVWLPGSAITALAVIIVAGHNLVDPFMAQLLPALRQSPIGWVWQVLYFGGPIRLGTDGPVLFVLYSIVPWIGAMAAGYAFGPVMLMEAAERKRWCLRLGLAAIGAFVILRGFNLYGDPVPWNAPETTYPPLLSFLNANKYPASLLFLLMTLGPTIAVIPVLERARGWWADALATFGRVPFFYYVVHIPLIHAVALLVSLVRTGAVDPWLFANHPVMNPPAPAGYTWSLGLLYLVFACVVAALYYPSRWFGDFKRRRRDAWLSYF
ncbi:MAG: DUF1624 domain-containing protein [Gemmatimonadales bacterium]